jgi:altronate hydrolase
MPLGLAQLATGENSAIHLHPTDNIAVARVGIAGGMELKINAIRLVTRDPIPAGHKVALRPIEAGEIVLRYGQAIGRARRIIEPGEHVHVHNLGYEELELNYEFPQVDLPVPNPPEVTPAFLGYAREDGRAGTRNYIAVVAASNCAAHTVEEIARSYRGQTLPPNVDGVVAFPHGEGCAHASGPDIDQLRRTLGGVVAHPNVSSALIVGLGCEVNQIDFYLRQAGRLKGLTLQSSGGTRATVEAGRREIDIAIERAAEEQRTEIPASKLVLGLNCGGSDSFSGITANPALGHCSDLLAMAGATSVLAETPEIFGAEHLLVRRARSRQVAEKLLSCISNYKRYLRRFEGSFDDNPSPGNKEGGLTNILEKSLGAAAKGGTSALIEVYEYAERISAPGFCFMNTPGYDPVSLSGLVAGGCNLIAFTTGRGSAIGFPTVPVLKIASNSTTYNRMRENMDVNAGAIADGNSSVEQMGKTVFDLLLEVASGKRTAAERMGHQEFVPWRIGPVM